MGFQLAMLMKTNRFAVQVSSGVGGGSIAIKATEDGII